MNEKNRNSKELPEHLERLLADETRADRDALARTWSEAGAPLRREPSDDAFARMGDEIWSNLKREMRNAPRPPRRASRRPMWRWTAAAAGVAALVLSGLAYFTWPTTVDAPPGDRLTMMLPDGSTVELNSGASLTYSPRSFGWITRTARLEGEAYFQVTKEDAPFAVRTFNAEVRVLGTSFNVKAWPDDLNPSTVVTLHSGSVRLTSRAGANDPVILQPGQISRVVSRSRVPTEPEPADINQATAWRMGRFVVVDEPLGAILAEMERRFGIEIRADSDKILTDRLSLAYDESAGAETMLRDISASYGRYTYRRIPGGFELYIP